MKLNKKVLKNIVKECLVEILAEGLVPGNESSVRKRSTLKESVNSVASQSSFEKRPLTTNGSYLDQVSYGSQEMQQAPAVNSRTEKVISKVTNDPIMSAIFADTAATTLVEQKESGSRVTAPTSPADAAARIVSQADPTDLFGESAGKWADLAFSPKISG